MSSTNKTTNYELSQFLGTDKPAWLSDYNADMSKIDTQMKLNNTAATAAQGTATSAANALGDVTSLETTDKSSAVAAINEVNTEAATAQQTANTANTNATKANTAITNMTNYFNLNDISALTWTVSAGSIDQSSSTTIALNNTKSLGKVYGQLVIGGAGGSGTLTATSSDTGCRPSSAITFNGCAIMRKDTSSENNIMSQISYTLGTDGKITVSIPRGSTLVNVYIFFTACILFIEDFGDVVIPPVQ